MSYGLPVITSADNGFTEVITPGEEGEILADVTDKAAIADALHRWKDSQKRAAIRPRLLEKGVAFSTEANLRETLAVIEDTKARLTL
jgi:UDP-glucose:(heptosyl)LPS alpha-1,3-glucosyltransferase